MEVEALAVLLLRLVVVGGREGVNAYRWYPSFQCAVPLEFCAPLGLEDELVVQLREGDALVGIEC